MTGLASRVRKQHLAPALLPAAHLALLGASFALSVLRPGDWAARNVFRVVVFGEAGLLAVWAATGTSVWQRRTTITSLGWLLCWVLLASRHPGSSPYWLGVYLLLPSFASLLLAMAIQWSQLRRIRRAGGQAGSRWQFTTSDLLVFTSAVGISIVLAQRFFASRLAGESMFLLCEGTQLSLLVALASDVGAPSDAAPASGAARTHNLPRLLFAALAAFGLGFIMQSYLSASYFWDAIRNLRNFSAGGLWEDFLSIPTTVLGVSLLTIATVRRWRRPKADGTSQQTATSP